MEINNYLDAADVVFDEMTDTLRKQMETNEQRETFGQPPIQYVINIKDFLAKTEGKARQVHASVERYGKDTHGSVVEWADKAKSRFKNNLLKMVRMEEDPALKSHLQDQIFELWPELIPLRSLTSEEVSELCELQLQADTLIDSLRQSINDAIEGLWAIATAELGIIVGTSVSNTRLINARIQCQLASMGAIVSTSWDRQAGKITEPAEQITRNFMVAAPCRWSDKKQRDETLASA